MSKSTSTSEISELVGYLRNIKEHEIKNFRSETSLANLSWGLIMIFAGIADLHVSYYAGYSPHFFIWIIAVGIGFQIQNYITSQPLIFDSSVVDDSEIRPKVPIVSIIITIIMFLFTIPLGNYKIELVLPYVAFTLGILNTLPRSRKMVEPEIRGSAELIKYQSAMFYVLTVVLLIQGFLGKPVQQFQGITFGLFFGITSITIGKIQRNFILNKSDTLQSEEEI